jgi:hypothetical protein
VRARAGDRYVLQRPPRHVPTRPCLETGSGAVCRALVAHTPADDQGWHSSPPAEASPTGFVKVQVPNPGAGHESTRDHVAHGLASTDLERAVAFLPRRARTWPTKGQFVGRHTSHGAVALLTTSRSGPQDGGCGRAVTSAARHRPRDVHLSHLHRALDGPTTCGDGE